MKRFAVIFGIIAALVAAFIGVIVLKTRADRPDVLLARLKAGSGDAEDLKMRLNLAHEDPIPAMIDAYTDTTGSVEFRADVLNLLFNKYGRSRDERIAPVLRAAIESPEPRIRRVAVDGFDLYGDAKERAGLVGCVKDPDPEIRKKTYIILTSGRGRSDLWDEIGDARRAALIRDCRERAKTEPTEEMRFLARSVVGREIEFLCRKAQETVSRGDPIKAEQMIQEALRLDPANQRAQIALVRSYFTADMKKKALAAAEKYGAVLHIPRLAAAPKIDGDPTDKAWDQAFRYVGKPFYHATSVWLAKTVEGRSDFYIGHYDGTLYLAVLGYEKDLDKLIVKNTARDSDCWRDDCVELFFDPTNSGTYGYQFVVNPVGAVFDLCTKNHLKSASWPCLGAGKIFKNRGYWACEFAITARDLDKSRIDADAVWGMNIMRTRIGPASEQCAWWPTFGFSHNIDLYPFAVFDGCGGCTSAPATKKTH